MPSAYEGAVTSSHDRTKTWSIIEAATYYDVPAILVRVGDWAVCTDGLYCLTTNYPISADRFDEHDRVDHMSEKNWVDQGQFVAALEQARALKSLGYVQVYEDEDEDKDEDKDKA